MKTVLIVDDDRVMAAILSMWLKRMGHAVMLEHDIPDALKVMKSRMVDAIILDLDMPSGCGTEVIEKLKGFRRTASIPVVVVSANDDPRVITKVLEVGADKFIVKPTSFESLTESLGLLFKLQDEKEQAKLEDPDTISNFKAKPVVGRDESPANLQSLVRMYMLKSLVRGPKASGNSR
jgi:DNA-binding response OmpR family regulator